MDGLLELGRIVAPPASALGIAVLALRWLAIEYKTSKEQFVEAAKTMQEGFTEAVKEEAELFRTTVTTIDERCREERNTLHEENVKAELRRSELQHDMNDKLGALALELAWQRRSRGDTGRVAGAPPGA